MEYTQWALTMFHSDNEEGLNPCCNGIYSMSMCYECKCKY